MRRQTEKGEEGEDRRGPKLAVLMTYCSETGGKKTKPSGHLLSRVSSLFCMGKSAACLKLPVPRLSPLFCYRLFDLLGKSRVGSG